MDSVQIKSQIAYEKIRNLILLGKKRPGTHLVLADLEKELSMGRGPVREALMRLDRSGLVTNIPYKGIVVAEPPSMKELVHLYTAQIQLETALISEAIDVFTERDILELSEIIEQTRDLSINNFIRLNGTFHVRLHACARLPHLAMIAQKTMEALEMYLHLYQPTQENCETALAQHLLIVQALRDKDKEKAIKSQSDNLRHGMGIVQRGYAATRSGNMEGAFIS